MKRLTMICLAALTAAALLPEDAAARDGVRRQRIVIYARPRYQAEPGTIYGYAPGYYVPGRVGVLYGPYPLNPNAPLADLRY
jgi:hypothetical protein